MEINETHYIIDALVFEIQGMKPMPMSNYYDLFPDGVKITEVR